MNYEVLRTYNFEVQCLDIPGLELAVQSLDFPSPNVIKVTILDLVDQTIFNSFRKGHRFIIKVPQYDVKGNFVKEWYYCAILKDITPGFLTYSKGEAATYQLHLAVEQ